MLDVICLGEALIDLVSTVPVASVADAPAFVPAVGGSPANAAVALARLGARSGFVGKVGDDPFGRHIARTFEADGVDTSRLLFESSARTALAFVALDDAARPDFMFYRHPSADMLLRPDELDPAYIASAPVFHAGSIILTAEPSRSATIEGLRLARAAGRLVSLDPNIRLNLYGSRSEAKRVLLPLLEMADIVKLSEEDLAALVDGGDFASGSAELLARGPRLVVVTRGKDGCFCRRASGTLAVPGYRVPVVDTTGAGDAFVAGLLAGLLARGAPESDPGALGDADLEPVLRFANAVGALTTTVRGAIPGLPTGPALRSFLLERGEVEAASLLAD